jgi:hypothetical protein
MHEVSFHTVPERVLTVRLDGAVEYETTLFRFQRA